MSSEEYTRQLKDKYGKRRETEFKAESPKVTAYFEAVSKRISPTYTIEKVLAVGGTGIVHLGRHVRFPQPIVLKINRPNVDAEGVSMVDNEAQVLPTLNHPNIIRVLDVGEIPELTPKLSYVVEPFITGSKPFFTFDKDRVSETWLHGKIEHLKRAMPEVLDVRRGAETGQWTGLVLSLLGDLAALISQWVSLLSHLHSKHDRADEGYVYLDVKPENVLIDEHLHLTSIDYGSVEHLDHVDLSPIEVFFTERYAHPTLIRRKKDKASSNRVRGGLKRSELTYTFDYFGLGMSMLEVLHEVALTRPHVVPQLPLYRSLHFLATRLLDGQNSNRPADDHYPLASQVFPSLRDSDYSQLAYDGEGARTVES
jgi:serine/threonine protein kinase